MTKLNYVEQIPDYIDIFRRKQNECIAIIQDCPHPAEYIKQ